MLLSNRLDDTAQPHLHPCAALTSIMGLATPDAVGNMQYLSPSVCICVPSRLLCVQAATGQQQSASLPAVCLQAELI